MMLMTGMLMSGKISTGVRRITKGVRIRISSDATIKVYGRLSAKRTIHIYIKVLGVAHFMPDCHRKKIFRCRNQRFQSLFMEIPQISQERMISRHIVKKGKFDSTSLMSSLISILARRPSLVDFASK